ncbi:E3 ubiquitin-protein ligase TRIM39-like isoform X18 [Saccopteryx bilineata]|uniref:E3 ubiquitin-protein ligase TRIM39-like isoform X18 n=1 Tax=Saccopteryx bilineata TaxID=59482 RepID=UPI00338D6724
MEQTPSNNEDSEEPKENEQIEKNKAKSDPKKGEFATEFAQFLQIMEDFKRELAEESAQEKRHVREKLAESEQETEQIEKNKAESEPKRGEFGAEFEKFNRKSAEQNVQEKTQFLHILEEFKRELAEQSAQEKARGLQVLAMQSVQEKEEFKRQLAEQSAQEKKEFKRQLAEQSAQEKTESEQEKRELKKTIEELKEKIAVSEQGKAKKERSKGFPGVTLSNKNKQISGEFKKKYAKTEQQTDELEKKIEECKETIAESEEQKRHMNIMIGEFMKKYDEVKKKIDTTEQHKDELEKKIEECKETIALIEEQRKECKETIALSEEQIRHMNRIIGELIKKYEEIKKKIEKYKETLAKSEQEKVSRNLLLYAEWTKKKMKAVTVTLDADTAHPALHLSENGRRVTWRERGQDLPCSIQRFDSLPCVLGQLFISSGRCYWEVEVGNAFSWDLGVCRHSVARKGRVTMSPQNGFWAIRLYSGEYWAVTSPETPLTVGEKPLKVGIFLDYEDGDVSFFNITDRSHIFSFPNNTFYGVLRPLFRLWSSDSGSLAICPSEEKEVTDVIPTPKITLIRNTDFESQC